MAKRLTYAIVGGGPDGFIDDTHRRTIGLDGTAAITAGVFSRNRERSLQMAESLGISPNRCYEDYQTMARAEGERGDDIGFVTVVTPSRSHYEICRAFLETGIHVVYDKPVTTTYRQTKELGTLAGDKGFLFMVTYTYMGYVTAKYARELVASDAIREVCTVMTEYLQGWLAFESNFEGEQGEWCYDPGQSGGMNCLGDLGTHVENAMAAMTGPKTRRLLVEMDVIIPGRVLDDNDSILVEYGSGVTEIYWTSQVAVSHDSSPRIRIYSSRGTVQWFQETPDKITVIGADNTIREIHCGYGAIGERAGKYARIPTGHPEGQFEVMDNLYRSFAQCVSAEKDGMFTAEMVDYPTMSQGAEGLAFVEACLESDQNGNTWVEFRGK